MTRTTRTHPTRRWMAALALLGSAGALAGCSQQSASSGSPDVVTVTQRLALAGVCRDVFVADAPGAVAADSPAADLVSRSLGCGELGDAAVVLSSFTSERDRDLACAGSSDPLVVCGTGEQAWLLRARDPDVLAQVTDTLGADVTAPGA